MKYSKTRLQICSGDLLAWRGTGFFSRLIARVTGGRHSHVAIAWKFRERLFILEARAGRGVQIRAASRCLPFDWIKTGMVWGENSETIALEQLGKDYSYLKLLAAGLNINLKSRGEICSSYAVKVLNSCPNLTIPEKKKLITPTDVVDYFLNQGCQLTPVKNQ